MGKYWAEESKFSKVTGVGDRAEEKATSAEVHSASTFPIANDGRPRNPRGALPAHFPGGSFSPCPLISLLSLLMTVSLNPNSSKTRWRSSRELENLHIPHFTHHVFSDYSRSHAPLKGGSEQSQVQELCFHSPLGIAHSLCSKSKKVQRKRRKKYIYGCGGVGKGSERVTSNDMPQSECII